jgi:hypothetical protein
MTVVFPLRLILSLRGRLSPPFFRKFVAGDCDGGLVSVHRGLNTENARGAYIVALLQLPELFVLRVLESHIIYFLVLSFEVTMGPFY